jgi:polyhydroxybutyrate depolymerase
MDKTALSTGRGSLVVGGHERTFVAVVPEQLAEHPALMLVFHGSNQSGETVRRFAGGTFDELAEREHLVVVYPDAYKRLWNDARVSSGVFPARRDGYDDVAFFHSLVAHFVEVANVDPDRVYAVGYSNGAQLVNRIIHEGGGGLAGAALIAATQPGAQNLLPTLTPSPIPLVLIQGTRDPIVPYDGGMASLFGFRPRGVGLSHLATAEYFATANGITTAPAVTVLPARRSPKNPVTMREWSEVGKATVRAYSVEGGGHVIPNPVKPAFPLMGATTKDLDSARAVWSFFEEQYQARLGRRSQTSE